MEPEWPEADVIIGNPPFLGDKKMRPELGDKYVDDCSALYGDRVPGQSDLVCYWFEKARAHDRRRARPSAPGCWRRKAIRGGANRRVLERIKETGTSSGRSQTATGFLMERMVHVSMVGFDNGTEDVRFLDGKLSTMINCRPDSHTRSDTGARLAQRTWDMLSWGPEGWPLRHTDETSARQMLARPANPNGRPNSDVVAPWVNGQDVTGQVAGHVDH